MLILIFTVVIVIPVAICFALYKWLAKRGYGKIAAVVFAGIFVYFCFTIYRDVYPPDRFYINDFEYYSKLKFPASGKIISKDASYPDFQGQYSSAAVISVSKEDFISLLGEVSKDSSYTIDTITGWRSQYFSEVTKGIDVTNVLKIVGNDQVSLEFLGNKSTIVFEKGPYPYKP